MSDLYLIGAGNVAWHLAKAFHSNELPICGIWSRDPSHAMELAEAFGGKVMDEPFAIPDDGSLAIIAVPDHAIPEIMDRFRGKSWQHTLFAHTSGATSIQIMEGPFQHYGVFYPLQSLTKGHVTGPWPIPLLVLANSEQSTERLEDTARTISSVVSRISDEERTLLHMSAVFINNFVNHLGGLALSRLDNTALNKLLLEPLAQETVRKMFLYRPEDIQTGPAKRGDIYSLEKHLRLLADDPRLAALYRTLSSSINPNLRI